MGNSYYLHDTVQALMRAICNCLMFSKGHWHFEVQHSALVLQMMFCMYDVVDSSQSKKHKSLKLGTVPHHSPLFYTGKFKCVRSGVSNGKTQMCNMLLTEKSIEGGTNRQHKSYESLKEYVTLHEHNSKKIDIFRERKHKSTTMH